MDIGKLKYFTDEFSKIYPLSHSLWRSFEACLLSEVRLSGPILDLGCGDGSFAKIFFKDKPADLEIVGVDICQSDCEKARKIGFYKEVACAPSHVLPFKESSFKSVFSNSVMEHIEKIDETLKELNRVLAPGGLLLFSAPSAVFAKNLFYEKIAGKAYGNFINGTFKHRNCLSPEEWNKKFTESNFNLVSVKPMLSKKTESLWDIFLPISFAQHLFVKKINPKMPLSFVNKFFIEKFVENCRQSEEAVGMGGGNLIIAAEKKI